MSVGSFTVFSWARILEFPHNFNFETLDKHLTIRMHLFKGRDVLLSSFTTQSRMQTNVFPLELCVG